MKEQKQAEQIAKILKGIQDRIPKNLIKNVIIETQISPTMLMVISKALADPSFPEEKKKQLQALKDSGEFEKKKYKEVPKIAKMINEFVEREIKKEIKKGNLPARNKIKNLSHVKDIYEKIHNK